MKSPSSCDLIVTLVDYYLERRGLKMSSKPNSDLAGIVKLFGETYTTSLSIIIISFLIRTGTDKGFSSVINLLEVSLTKDVKFVSFNGSDGLIAKLILYEMNSNVTGLRRYNENFTWDAFKPYTDNLYSLVASPGKSNIVAALINTLLSSTSNFHSTLNLWAVFSQFLIGIMWIKFSLALHVKSKVFKNPVGFAVPIILYISAVPSGIGKKREASCNYCFIAGTSSFLVIVKGR